MDTFFLKPKTQIHGIPTDGTAQLEIRCDKSTTRGHMQAETSTEAALMTLFDKEVFTATESYSTSGDSFVRIRSFDPDMVEPVALMLRGQLPLIDLAYKHYTIPPRDHKTLRIADIGHPRDKSRPTGLCQEGAAETYQRNEARRQKHLLGLPAIGKYKIQDYCTGLGVQKGEDHPAQCADSTQTSQQYPDHQGRNQAERHEGLRLHQG